MWAVVPRILLRISFCRPVMRPSATMSAITPTTTPSTEMAEMIEMKACLRLAVRYRRAINNSNGRDSFPPEGAGISNGRSAEGAETSLRSRLDMLAISAVCAGHSFACGRICGNRITSRIDGESVRIMASRSMPTPHPPVGGRPWPSART